MSEILNKDLKVLKLNKFWWAIGTCSVEKAMGEIFSLGRNTGLAPQIPVDVTYPQNEDGSYDFDSVPVYRPVTLAEWLTLPVRSCDWGIQTARQLVRVPTVTICANFINVPDRKPRFSSENVRIREGGRCAVTKRLLAPGEGDLGHDVARYHGGKRTWDNVAFMDKQLNRQMGTKTFEEMGWGHVRKQMVEPKSTKVLLTVHDVSHPSQLHFVQRN